MQLIDELYNTSQVKHLVDKSQWNWYDIQQNDDLPCNSRTLTVRAHRQVEHAPTNQEQQNRKQNYRKSQISAANFQLSTGKSIKIDRENSKKLRVDQERIGCSENVLHVELVRVEIDLMLMAM
jgi:hypothetical protein